MTKASLGIVSIKFVIWAVPTCSNQYNRENGDEKAIRLILLFPVGQ